MGECSEKEHQWHAQGMDSVGPEETFPTTNPDSSWPLNLEVLAARARPVAVGGGRSSAGALSMC